MPDTPSTTTTTSSTAVKRHTTTTSTTTSTTTRRPGTVTKLVCPEFGDQYPGGEEGELNVSVDVYVPTRTPPNCTYASSVLFIELYGTSVVMNTALGYPNTNKSLHETRLQSATAVFGAKENTNAIIHFERLSLRVLPGAAVSPVFVRNEHSPARPVYSVRSAHSH